MGVLLRAKSLIFLSVVGVAALCGIGVAVYFYKMSLVTPISTDHGQINVDDDHDYLGDDPNNAGNKGSSSNQICVGEDWECYARLDKKVRPTHYDLYLYPDIGNGTFTGKVSIMLKTLSILSHIRLHTKYLNITETVLTRGLDNILLKKSFEYPANEYWVVIPESPIEPSRYNLTLNFNGLLTRGITGFYRSSYFDPVENTTKYVVSTKFQPTHARKAFPCFDEPGLKSTFTISLVKPTELVALSNMPVENEELETPSTELTTVKFMKSKEMVTYLAVVAIGDFAYTEGKTKSNKPVRIYSTSFQVNKTRYAVEIAPKIIDFFEDYFNVPFPLPKLDIIGIPDFVSGAMEHWGLISFREANLLYQPGVASAGNKQRIATVIAHELAHMWFGNLVTMEWWDDLYLNEGFASFMEYKGVESVHPDWDIESQFGSSDLTPVMILDGKQSSHPIVQEVQHPDQITEIFDTISYNKGSSVLRMLESFMTPAKFRHGITQFLEEYSFRNAKTEDLWYFLQVEMGYKTEINISLIMDTWTKQMSYPVIAVQIKNGTIKLAQERFVDNRNKFKNLKQLDKESPFNYTWEIPLQISDDDNYFRNTTLHWMHYTQKSKEIEVDKDLTWVKVNTGQYGYFRVNFENSTWNTLKDVYSKSFSPIERCGLLDDALSLANAGYLNYSVALDFMTVANEEMHYVPWECLDGHLKRLSSLLRNAAPDAYPLYRKLVKKLTLNIYGSLNWTDSENEPHLQRFLKSIIFSLSCENGDQLCLKTTKQMFNSYILNDPSNNTIPSDLRGIVYKWGMWQSNETIWDIVWNRYLSENDAQEKIRLMSCLAFSSETWIIQRLIERAKNETLVRRQDFFLMTKFVSQNPVGNPILWKFYRNEYKGLVNRFSVNDRYFGRLILDITSEFASKVQLNEMQSLFFDYPEAGAGRRARETAIENVENNIEWIAHNAHTVEQWLKAHIS